MMDGCLESIYLINVRNSSGICISDCHRVTTLHLRSKKCKGHVEPECEEYVNNKT